MRRPEFSHIPNDAAAPGGQRHYRRMRRPITPQRGFWMQLCLIA